MPKKIYKYVLHVFDMNMYPSQNENQSNFYMQVKNKLCTELINICKL